MKKPKAAEWRLNDRYEKKPSSMRDRIVGMIDGAEEMVIISSYLLADDGVEKSLIRAYERGARCYIMTATASRLQKMNMEFDEDEYRRHQSTLSALTDKALVRSSGGFHAKIVITDPKSDDARGLLSTANLTTAGLERNHELFVWLEKDEIRQAMSVLKWAFWEHSEYELADNASRPFKPLGSVSPANPEKILQTTPDHKSILDEAMRILDKDPKSVMISSFGWDMDSPVVKRLCDLSRNGTKVTVIARNGKSTIPVMKNMKKAGITIIGFKWLHATAIVSDSSVMVMSANLDRYGLEDAFELGIRLEGRRAELVRKELQGYVKNPEYEFVLIPANNSNKS